MSNKVNNALKSLILCCLAAQIKICLTATMIHPGINKSVKFMLINDKFCIMSSNKDNFGQNVVIYRI